MKQIMRNMFGKGKKKRIILVIEIFFSFIAFFIVFSLITKKVANTSYPLGFEYEDVYKINFKYPNISWDSIEKIHTSILDYMQAYTEVEKIGKWYASFAFQEGYMNPSNNIKYKNSEIPASQVESIWASDEISDVLKIELIEGRWFNEEDNALKNRPVVINQKLKYLIFGNENALGEIINICDQQCKIVGICNNFKHKGDFTKPRNILIVRNFMEQDVPYETSNCVSCSSCGIEHFLKVSDNKPLTFEIDLIRDISTKFPGFNLIMFPFEKQHDKYVRRTILPLLLVFIFLIFLFLNVVFGLFGVLWYSISLRKSEIGLRMAVGANKKKIYGQFVREVILLATLGIVPGIIIAIQFPILKVFDMEMHLYFIAMLLSAVIIYFLVILCALFPSKQAARIQPAIALHED